MNHPVLHAYPAAVTAPQMGERDEALNSAVASCIEQDAENAVLISVADRRHLQTSKLAQNLVSQGGYVADTRNRGPRRSWRGPVVGFAVDRRDLAAIPFREATAVCLVPWGVNYEDPETLDTELRPWVTGTGAVGVGDNIRWSDGVETGTVLDEADAAYMRLRTGRINFANPLSATREKRDLVSALRGLKSRTGHIDVDAAEAWAWSQGWDGGQVAVLRDYSEKINAGKTLRVAR